VIAVHFDNTWNSTIATENISRALKTLEFPLHTLVVDNEEYDDIQRSFISAGVPDIETPTDVALAATLYKAARKYKTKYILEGHSFRTEGLGPIGWFYIDGKYVASVQRQFGTQKLDTFPNLWLSHFLYWTGVNRIKKLRPLYYIDYDKESVKQMLTKELGWQWYGGHHLENRFTAFTHSYYLPYRFGIETRVLGFAAAARTGHMARDEALRLLEEPFHIEEGLLELVLKRLGYSPDEFATLMSAPLHSYRDYKTYKHTFERMRPILGVMAKYDLVPKSFYMKYTKPDTNRLAWEGRRPPTIEELPLLSGLADEANSL